jgi:hypothetical protein
MGIRSFIIVTLDLKAAMNADADLMGSSLLKLIQNEFESDNSREDCGVWWRYLGTAESADGIAVIKMFIEASNPFTSGDGITECSGKTGGTQLRERGNGEQLSNKCRIIISTLEERQVQKLVGDVRADGGI